MLWSRLHWLADTKDGHKSWIWTLSPSIRSQLSVSVHMSSGEMFFIFTVKSLKSRSVWAEESNAEVSDWNVQGIWRFLQKFGWNANLCLKVFEKVFLQKEIETKGRLLQKLLEESFLVNTLLESRLVTRVIQKHMPSRYRREAKSNLYINRTLWYFISVCGVRTSSSKSSLI